MSGQVFSSLGTTLSLEPTTCNTGTLKLAKPAKSFRGISVNAAASASVNPKISLHFSQSLGEPIPFPFPPGQLRGSHTGEIGRASCRESVYVSEDAGR